MKKVKAKPNNLYKDFNPWKSMEKEESTSYLKIDFNINPTEEIKKRIFFPNSEIKKITSREKPGFFYKFTFNTVFEYLDKKESISNEIYVFNSKPIEGDLSEYLILEGDFDKSKVPNFKNSYFIAKEEVKKRIQEKTNKISRSLGARFEKEKEHIEQKFESETKQFQKELEEITEKLMEFARKGEVEKISEQKKLINSLKEKSNFLALEEDKVREIQLENQKHFLNVENKLEKTTIIYYPIYVFTIDVKAEPLKKSFMVEFDPLAKEVSGVTCESCANKVKEIFICSGGHATCKNCSTNCESCGKKFCKKCLKNTCEICSKKICRTCSVRCFRCSRLICEKHTRKDPVTGRNYCNNCSKRCERCEEMKDPFTFKVSKKTNAEICENCYRKEMQGNVLQGVFEN